MKDLAAITIFLVAILFIFKAVFAVQCHSRFSSLEPRYTFFSGCMVKYNTEDYIHYRALRVVKP